MSFKDRLIDPRSPDRRPRRAAYALPTLFTAGNTFLGFLAIIRCFQGGMAAITGDPSASAHFEAAAKAIGIAVFLDGLDGRIARMTNTVSDFGREMDSLSDVISFGIAPAVLAFTWGVQFVQAPYGGTMVNHVMKAGYVLAFLYLLSGSSRLARFNVQTNPIPKNPGRPDRKYFVGLPIPAAASLIAAIVYTCDGAPLRWWVASAALLALMGLLSFLMVSTWRYPSFKDLSLLRPRAPLTIVVLGSLIPLIWYYSNPVLLLLATTYVASGMVLRTGGILRRRSRRGAAQQASSRHQANAGEAPVERPVA